MADKTCFVIAPIGDQDSDTRKRSDQILKHVIAPALAECGYKAIRADQIAEPGVITSQVIQHIVDDQLVVADLTDRNPNVFYELAIRHVIRKPLVQIIRKGDSIPFDVAGTRTIHVDHHDLDSFEEAKKDVIAQVRFLDANPTKIETPISVSLDLQLLRQSDNPEQRSLADIVSVMSELRASVANVEKRLEHPETLMSKELLRILERNSMRNSRSKHLMLEMRGLVEELQVMYAPERSRSTADRKEMESRLLRLRHYLDMLVHDEEFRLA